MKRTDGKAVVSGSRRNAGERKAYDYGSHKCDGCPAPLSRYNPGPLCRKCELKAKPKPLPTAAQATATPSPRKERRQRKGEPKREKKPAPDSDGILITETPAAVTPLTETTDDRTERDRERLLRELEREQRATEIIQGEEVAG